MTQRRDEGGPVTEIAEDGFDREQGGWIWSTMNSTLTQQRGQGMAQRDRFARLIQTARTAHPGGDGERQQFYGSAIAQTVAQRVEQNIG